MAGWLFIFLLSLASAKAQAAATKPLNASEEIQTKASWLLLTNLNNLQSGKVISNPSFNSILTKVVRHGLISSMIVISRGFVRENN